MSANEPGRARTFNTADPAEHERLRFAWDNFEYMLETPGVVASDLDPADLDYVIADLVAIGGPRPRRAPSGGAPGLTGRASGDQCGVRARR